MDQYQDKAQFVAQNVIRYIDKNIMSMPGILQAGGQVSITQRHMDAMINTALMTTSHYLNFFGGQPGMDKARLIAMAVNVLVETCTQKDADKQTTNQLINEILSKEGNENDTGIKEPETEQADTAAEDNDLRASENR